MSRQSIVKLSHRFMRGVIVTGSVLVAAGAGVAHADARTQASAHVSATTSGFVTGEDDLGWQ
ncbi:hypothetical protein AB0I51_17520 [Streptomyces sp. NPDC050549]|uniref:hypothetical protein n=1 Tax=Streptomyces sp. NPDC050549 TaxID=3155406 RepID=UPI003428E8FD